CHPSDIEPRSRGLKMKVFARFALGMAALLLAAISAQAQRTTTHTDETSNNTTGCATPTSSYVGTTSCQANFPGANDDSSAGTAQIAFMKRLKIDGIVGNPPGPLPLNLPSQDSDPNNPKNRNVNEAMSKWKTAADNDSSGFLYSIMTDQVMWKQNTICTAAAISPSCVEKVMTCSLDFMNTATTGTFTCVLEASVYSGGGFFADTHYWKEIGRPVMSYFLDESSVFTQCTSTAPCAVYNDNQPGTTCTSSSDCWQKIYGGIAHHINTFSAVPIVINRDNFGHLPT